MTTLSSLESWTGGPELWVGFTQRNSKNDDQSLRTVTLQSDYDGYYEQLQHRIDTVINTLGIVAQKNCILLIDH